MVANSGHLSTLSSAASLTLTDKVDSPHSGLFQSLHVMTQGNYALKDHASALGFAHTFAGGGSPNVEVTAGKAFFDGKYVAVAALPSSPVTLTKPSSGALYHWVVAQDDGDGTYSCAIVAGSADGVVPDLNTTSVTVEKVPISLIKVQSTDTASTVAVQYFTTSKEQNSLSVGYSASDVYAEKGSLTASASGLLVAGTTATIVTTPYMSLGNADANAGALRLLEDTDNGANYTGFKAPAAVTADTLYTLPDDYPASNKILQSTDAGILSWETAATGTAVLTGSTNNTITTVTGANAITGEANLTFDATDSTLTIKSIDDDAAIDPTLILKRDSGNPANDDLLGEIGFYGRNLSDDADVEYGHIHVRSVNISDSNSAKESSISFNNFLKDTNAGSISSNLILGSEEITFNTNGFDLDTRIESDDETHMFFVDGGNNRISIGDSVDAPAATLEITNHASAGAFGVPLLQLNSNDTDKVALDINAANIDADVLDITANALTTGKAINLTTSSVPADAGTSIVNSFVMANTSTNSQTAKGLFFDFNKTGITASGKTANVTGMQIDIDDSVTNVGTVNITGLDIDVDFGNAGGTVKTVGLDVAVGAGGTAADTTYAALFSGGNVGIGTATPMNILQVNHTGADTDDGVLIVRDDASTADGDLLGGMGFDSADGNIPSTVTEASAFIASYATEDHAATDKGGNLKFGVSLIDENDDVVSTVLATVGPPDTLTNATCVAGFHSRATVATIGDATYSPALTCSGTIIVMSHADTIITLPDVATADIGVQFTIINNTADTISGQIVSADTSNTLFHSVGGLALGYEAQAIAGGQAITYLCVAADTWRVLSYNEASEGEEEP